MSQIRMERINEEMRKAVSDVIKHDLHDPQISDMATITSVEVTRDLKYATVYVSVYDSEKLRAKSIQTLNRAAGFIAHEVGKRVDLRRLPQLTFKLDTNIEYGVRMSQLIDSVVGEKDEADH